MAQRATYGLDSTVHIIQSAMVLDSLVLQSPISLLAFRGIAKSVMGGMDTIPESLYGVWECQERRG